MFFFCTQIKLRMGNLLSPAPKMSTSCVATPITHHKCRNQLYPRGKNINRFQVPDALVSWKQEYPEYKPVEFVSDAVLKKPVWADPDFK